MDLIDRQAAIDAFCKECYDTDGEICDRDDVCGNVMILKNMPSVQPETSILTVTVAPDSEEIERVVRKIKDAPVMALPSAQPEIIRCKDCKHRPIATRADEGVLWGFSVEFPDERCPLQCEDGWYNTYPKDDFYCANAERRTDEAV